MNELFWVGVVTGLVVNLFSSAIFEWYKETRNRRAQILHAQEDRWRQRLGSPDVAERSSAFQDVLMRVIRWFLLGNVMFGLAGLNGFIDALDAYPLSNIVTTVSSLVAVVMFGFALSWIKKYQKYAYPPQTAAPTAPAAVQVQ